MLVDVARKPITFTNCAERPPLFAPSWELLNRYRNGIISWDQYTAEYLADLNMLFEIDPDLFVKMASRLDDVEFVCWCDKKKNQDGKCHKYLLKEFLEKIND